jgi:hypothetical protein
MWLPPARSGLFLARSGCPVFSLGFSLYEELRVLAIGDGDAVVWVTMLEKLCKVSDFYGFQLLDRPMVTIDKSM